MAKNKRPAGSGQGKNNRVFSVGKKVAQGEGLTSRQKEFLAVVLQTPTILKHFYLTGGTALNSWYLHHRESYDLDFFSEHAVDGNYLLRWLSEKKQFLNIKSIKHEQQFGFHFFLLTYKTGDKLKIDFSHFPPKRANKGLIWNNLQIDSLYDIALKKIQTIGSNPRVRDYIDLYLILKEKKWDLNKLINDAGSKHGIYIGILHLSRQFLRVSEFRSLPKMLVPFDRKNMENFFINLAKSLKGEVFKE